VYGPGFPAAKGNIGKSMPHPLHLPHPPLNPSFASPSRSLLPPGGQKRNRTSAVCYIAAKEFKIEKKNISILSLRLSLKII
jgi:hypothetical protein